MSAINDLIKLDGCKSIVPFGDGTDHHFSHTDLQWLQDPTGISTREIDFLYGLVRIMRPLAVLETGTNYGCSASAICLGLSDNRFGHLTTIEHSQIVADVARKKLSSMGFSNFSIFTGEIADFPQPEENSIDLLWLDSELGQRYAELVRFFSCMKVGAIACMHDHPYFGINEFGDMPDELGKLIRTGSLSIITFPTIHGVTLFQRRCIA